MSQETTIGTCSSNDKVKSNMKIFFCLFKAHTHTPILAGSVLDLVLDSTYSSVDLCADFFYQTGTFKSPIPTSDLSKKRIGEE